MRYTKYFLFAIIILILPFIVKADTWLDDPSYYDTSWFDPDTYESTTKFTIDTPEKLAGLVYLVNEEGFTFAGKEVRLYTTKEINIERSKRSATYISLFSFYFYVLDMREHDWIPIDSRFQGTINRKIYYNSTVYSDNETYVLISGNNINDFSFSLNNVYNNYMLVSYNVSLNKNEGGEITYGIPLADDCLAFFITPEANHKLKKIDMFDEDGNEISINQIELYSSNQKYYLSNIEELYNLNISDQSVVVFRLPYKKVTVNIEFEEFEKAVCKVIHGDGKKVGSEIACGQEHFYVIDSNDNKIRMLAKYNLFTGNIIHKEKIEKEAGDTRTDQEYCSDLASSMGGTVRTGGVYNEVGYCFINTTIENKPLLRQNENAISARWDSEGNFVYPQVGDVYLAGEKHSYFTNKNNSDFSVIEDSSEKYDGYFYDLQLNEYNVSLILDKYSHTLSVDGVDLENIDLMTLDDINNIIKANNKTIPFKEWYDATKTAQPPRKEFAWLNEYIRPEDSFLYNSTYWIRSGYDKINDYFGVNSVIFVDSYGGVCGSEIEISGGHNGCETLMNAITQAGCGIRPVITISTDDLEYAINTETDDNGNIEVVNSSKGDKPITFKVNGKKGYKLGTLVIKTSTGEEMEFTEGELITNEDGTVSITNNKFTMPYESVTLVANFVSTNPDTGITILKYIVILFISINGLLLMYDNKDKIKYLFRYN